MDKGGRGGGHLMWIIFEFYIFIIKSPNVDRGGGGTMGRIIALPYPKN
jgi:hypothetical protein